MKIIGIGVLCLATSAMAGTLQERIDAAAPNDTIHLETGVHPGPVVIRKPVKLVGEKGAEIKGNGSGNAVTIKADDVTLSGLRISRSGLRLSDDDSAIFITGNRARIALWNLRHSVRKAAAS